MNEKTRTPDWNPAEHVEIDDRMAHMKQMREHCPVAYTERGGGGWGLLRYQDIVAATLDPENFRNGGAPRHGQALAPLEVDPPVHRDYRRLLTPFFTAKRMQQLEPQIRQFAQDLLAPIIARGHADLAREFSYPLPVLSLCTVLGFGVDRWEEIKRVSEDTLLVESADVAERERARVSHEALLVLARELVADRRAHPRDVESDLPSAILAAKIEDKPIGDDAAAGMLRLLISAGHNSTTSGLGNALLHLARDVDAQQQLRTNPAAIPTAIEEILRYDTPVQAMPRRAAKELTLHGRTIEPGEKIDMFWAAANRDETVFTDPDTCILDRQPNRHLTFGHGIHLCLGAPMARLEIRVALEELLKKTRSFSVDGQVGRTHFHRVGVTSLPVRFGH
ncbi:MAG TPA: cytochrome P450 [Steroidobacteraceae bacterium]|nr:cytochrome P450 [Steroidobacteraceae bacterium]